jgi:hypothetical protein
MAMHDNIQESVSSTENPLLATRPVATSAGNHLRRARLRRRIVDEGQGSRIHHILGLFHFHKTPHPPNREAIPVNTISGP